MPIVAASIAAAGSIGGGLLGAQGARDAAQADARAQRQALALQRQIYGTNLGLNEPWRATGQGALNSLARLYGLPYQDYTPAQTLFQGTGGGPAGGGATFGAKAVARMLRQGMSIQDIAKLGSLRVNGKTVNVQHLHAQ